MNRHRKDIVYCDDYVSAYCMLRNEPRTFKLSRFLSIQVLASKYCNSNLINTIPEFYCNKAWRHLLSKEFVEAEISARAALFYDQNHLIAKGNLAHALVFQGDLNGAAEIYQKHMGDEVTNDLLWENMIQNDIGEFLNAEIDIEDLLRLMLSMKDRS